MTDKGVSKWGDLGALRTPVKIDKIPELLGQEDCWDLLSLSAISLQ